MDCGRTPFPKVKGKLLKTSAIDYHDWPGQNKSAPPDLRAEPFHCYSWQSHEFEIFNFIPSAIFSLKFNLKTCSLLVVLFHKVPLRADVHTIKLKCVGMPPHATTAVRDTQLNLLQVRQHLILENGNWRLVADKRPSCWEEIPGITVVATAYAAVTHTHTFSWSMSLWPISRECGIEPERHWSNNTTANKRLISGVRKLWAVAKKKKTHTHTQTHLIPNT